MKKGKGRFMKYANVAVAAVAAWVAGCTSTPRVVVAEAVGPPPVRVSERGGEGALAVYSARTPAVVDLNQEEWRWNNDFGKNAFLYEPAHSDYTFSAPSGGAPQRVRNARDEGDGDPAVVRLPAGTYRVEAEAVDRDAERVMARMTVVVKPGQTTRVHLEGGWRPAGKYDPADLSRLPSGRPIGWRAPEGGIAASAPGQ
jgi:hypothetical protein